MNHRELTIAAACILALIATTADAKGCRGKAKLRDECREPVTPPPDPTPEPEPQPEPKPEPQPEPEPKDPPKKPKKDPKPVKKPAPKKRLPEPRDNGSSATDRVRTKVYCLEPKKSLITDQRYLGGKYDIAPERCCVEAVSRWDARKACKIVWGK